MIDQPKELLRKIDKIRGTLLSYQLLMTIQKPENCDNIRENISESLEFLVPLRSLLEGDVGQDGEEIRVALQHSTILEKSGHSRDHAFAALSRLSARAKIGEAQIREAKREVLKKIREQITTQMFVVHKTEPELLIFLTFIDRELAALKEAKDG